MRLHTRIAVYAANVLLIILGTAVPVLSLLAFALDAFCLFRFGKADSFALLLFLMPFAVVFKVTVGMPSLFQFLVLVAAGIFAFRRGRFSAKPLIVLLLFVGYIAAGAMNSVGMLIKFAGGFALLYFFTEEDESENTPLYTYALTAGFLTSSVIGWFGPTFAGLANYVEVFMEYRINGVDAPRFTALYGDPNYYTVGVILSLSLLLLLYTRNRIKMPVFLLTVLPLIFFGFKTGSKSFLLLLALLCLAFFYILLKRGNYWVVWAAIILFAVAIVVLFAWENNPLQIIIARLLEQEEGDIATGRFGIWRDYIEYLLGNVRALLFGEGLGAPIPETATNVPHSTYLDCFYYLGIFGTVIISALVFILLRRNLPKERPDFANCVAPVMLLLLYAFLSELYYGEIPFHLMLVWVGFVYARPTVTEKSGAELEPPAFLPLSKRKPPKEEPLFLPQNQ